MRRGILVLLACALAAVICPAFAQARSLKHPAHHTHATHAAKHTRHKRPVTLSQVSDPSQSFSANGSAEQIWITGLSPSERMSLIGPNGHLVTTKTADGQGGLIFYSLTPGSGYRVRVYPSGASSPSLTVHSDAAAPWDPNIDDQSISDSGYQYLTVRDGVQLAIDVHPPPAPAGVLPGLTLPSLGDYSPPYPTLIEYSGYGFADPAGPENGIAAIANLMGFAVVDVNMRGTGCSGGAYNFFEPLQNLDAYDVIQTIAHQPWVLDHKVGMLGISYGAISQLFAAQLDPPALEAIAPMSTIDATATTLYPGGILNTGFALAWAEQRQADAEPALNSSYDQSWAWTRIANGDSTCKANQALHGEAQNLITTIAQNTHYKPGYIDTLDPDTFVNKIHVPVFMACQWEDEQTGGHCADLVQHMTGTDQKWFTFTNGAHIDSLDPDTLDRLYDFYSLFVAHQAPLVNSAVFRTAAPVIYNSAMGPPTQDAITLPSDPIMNMASYSQALAAFEAQPEVRVLFDNGAGTNPQGQSVAGEPYPGFEADFSSLPVPGTQARYFYLGAGGSMNASAPPARAGSAGYRSDSTDVPANDYGTYAEAGGLWGVASQWDWKWVQDPSGTSVGFLSAPLSQNMVVVGAGAVHLWVKSSEANVDLQATVSEVDPDGDQTFVQNGWLAADERALSHTDQDETHQASTLLEPQPSYRLSQVRPMPKGKYVELTIPLYYEGHAYRAGSRLELTISAPNDTQPVWAFQYVDGNGARVSVAYSPKMPSSLILPVISGVAVPTGTPACGSLRDEPCRSFVPAANGG